MDNIVVLKIDFNFGNVEDAIYPVMLNSENEMVLLDCGYLNFMPMLEEASNKINIDFTKLTKVIITHHDHDHMGSLAAIKDKYPNINIIAHEKDAPYIEGIEKSLRLRQAEQIQPTLPLEQQEFGKIFQSILKAVENVKVDITVKDGDYFPWCGGIEIIETPGHMPGHISIYLKKFKTLISGDALVIENGKLEIAAAQYTLDMEEAKKSVAKLLKYDIQKVICYHGGEYEGNIQNALKNIVNEKT